MKKLFVVFVTLFALISFAGLCLAEDVILNATVEKVVLKKDKNSVPFARIIIASTKELQGVKYESSQSVMAFQDQYTQAARLKKGDVLHAVCSKQDYKGNASYSVLKFIK